MTATACSLPRLLRRRRIELSDEPSRERGLRVVVGESRERRGGALLGFSLTVGEERHLMNGAISDAISAT